MSESIIIALVSAGSGIIGGVAGAVASLITGKKEQDVKSSDLLLEAQRQLTETIADGQLLWQWNRQLVDHIWRKAPPPPPQPPQGLFDHDHDN